jgi:hypothetical protein
MANDVQVQHSLDVGVDNDDQHCGEQQDIAP